MALIGTVSGSIGAGGLLTSRTAISGTLVIADSPASSFPALASGVKLFVSGAKSSNGADAPSAIFGGDAFVSGALGTDSYFQMKPVNTLRIPTNTTASYIYTSGSTNDMYFTQYNGPYTNTTRLRWIESQIQTGLLRGGVISSTSGSTTYNISSGSGIIVSPNASLTGDPYPAIQYVQWGNLNNQPLPSLGTTQITYVALDSTATPYLHSVPFVSGEYTDYIVLGRVLHTDKVGTNGAVNQPQVSYGTNQFRGDFFRAFGPIKLNGHTLYVSGTTGLKKDAGDAYAEGRNYTTDPNSPNYVSSTTDTTQNTSKIFYEYVNASGDDVILNNGNSGYTAVDFAQYNNAGTLATVGTGNKFTIQRVYWFPNAVNRAFYVYYGNTIYTTIAEAQAGIATEVFTEGKNTRDAAIFLGYLIVKGTLVDFTDPTTYKVIQAGPFRAVASAGGGSSGSPGGADTYVQFNDSSVFGGTSDFRFVKGTGTVSMAKLVVSGTSAGSLVSSGSIQVKDSGGNVVANISTTGDITGSRVTSNAAGSLAIGGGQVYLNGASSNRIDFSSQGTGDPAFNAPTAGTKVVLYPAAGASATDYALGISPATLWQSLPQADPSMMFKWYGGTTILAVLSGSGNMEISGDLAVNGGDITTTAGTFNLVNSTATTVNLGGGASTVNIGTAGSSTTFAGNITGSNARLSGDLAVNGGDITSTAGTFNIAGLTNVTNLYGSNLLLGATSNVNLSGSSVIANAGVGGLSFQRDGSTYATLTGDATTISIGATPSRTTANFFNGNVTTLNIAGAGTAINIGAGTGRTSIFNNLVIGTGNILVTNDATPITLISSGNIVAKLDINNNGAGHQFQIQDYLGINQLTVSENGTTEVSGTLLVSGTINMGNITERLVNSNASTGIVSFDLTQQGIFYVNAPAADITANFTSTPTTNLRVITPTVILSQSTTARIVSGCQIDGTWQTINWANGTVPTGTAGKQDVFGFSLVRSGSAWKVLGQLSTYG